MLELVFPNLTPSSERRDPESAELALKVADPVSLPRWTIRRLADRPPYEPVKPAAVSGRVTPLTNLDAALGGAPSFVPLDQKPFSELDIGRRRLLGTSGCAWHLAIVHPSRWSACRDTRASLAVEVRQAPDSHGK